MSEKIISICIPTYNGAKVIAKTLDSIIQDANKIENINAIIEIVLTDDCSSDETLIVISSYAAKYEYVKVFKNEINLGMDGNFKKTALNAEGKYVWYSGQDDIFLEGALSYVYEALKNNPDLGVININFSQFSDSKGTCICPSMFSLQSYYPEKIDFNKDLLFDGAKEYFSFFNDSPSFLPATVMKRSYWLSTDNDIYLGTHFIQYATILLNLNKAKILAITRPLIRGLVPSTGWQTNGNKLFSIQLGIMKARALVFEDKNNPFPSSLYFKKKIFYMRRFLRMVIASRYYRFCPSPENKEDLKMIYGRALYYIYFLPILVIVTVTPYYFINWIFSFKKLLVD